MRLIQNLSDEELTDVLLKDEEQSLRGTLESLPKALQAITNQPESFWQRQQAAIRERTTAVERGSMGLVLARVAAAILIVAGVLLLQSAPPAAEIRIPVQSDQQLLVSVERSVHSDVPEALEPAALLADDVFGSVQPQASPVAQQSSQGEQQ